MMHELDQAGRHEVVRPFVTSMLAGLLRRNDVFFPDVGEPLRIFKELTEWQLSTSSLNHQFSLNVTDRDNYPVNPSKVEYNTSQRGRLTICVSGGVDSTVAALWAVYALNFNPQTVDLLTVNYGAPYAEKERVVLQKLLPILNKGLKLKQPRNGIGPFSFEISHVDLGLETIPEAQMGKGYIIPNRNSVISAVASLLSDEIWIVSNYRKIDDEPGAAMDKNRKYYWTISHLLSQMYGRPMRVTSPFLHLSKAESIKWLIDEFGIDYANELISTTVTCYHPTELACGNCFACFKAAKSLWELTGPFPQLTAFDDKFLKFKGNAPQYFKEYIDRERMKGRTGPSEPFLAFFGLSDK